MRGGTDTVTLTVQFEAPVVLREVEMYLFQCPAMGIGAESILVHNSDGFPTFLRTYASRGSVTLGADMEDCDSLVRISVLLAMSISTANYAIEFHNPSGDLIEWVYIAELRLSDQHTPIATTGPGTATGEEPSESTTVPSGETTESSNGSTFVASTEGVTTEDSNNRTTTTMITEDPNAGDADFPNSTSLVPLPSTTVATGTSPPILMPPNTTSASYETGLFPIPTPIFTTDDTAPASADPQRSSYITLVAVAVVMMSSLFALLVVSLTILFLMRRKYKKIERRRRESAPVKVPSLRRHTIM